MANGSTVSKWHSYGDWSTSTSNGSVTITLTVGMQAESWGYNISGISGWGNIAGTSASFSGKSYYSPTGGTTKTGYVTVSKTISRGHSAQTASISWSVTNSSGYHSGTSTGSGSVTIPAVAHCYVSFDANGGTGAPSKIDKWYGEDLKIPSTIPTRTNYTFLGWAKTSTGDPVYQAGQTYSGTADGTDYTLYAIWKLAYIAPSFTAASAVRTSSITSTTPTTDGEYGYAYFTWAVDRSIYSDNTLKSVSITVVNSDGGSITPVISGATSGTSGTTYAHFALSSSLAGTVTCTVVDQYGMSTVSKTIATATVPLDIAQKGTAVGLLSMAGAEDTLRLGKVELTGANALSATSSHTMQKLDDVLSSDIADLSKLEWGDYNYCLLSTQKLRVFAGSIVKTIAASDSTQVWAAATFKSTFGTDSLNAFVAFENGDGAAQDVHIDGATRLSGNVYAVFNKKAVAGAIRINYLVVCWA